MIKEITKKLNKLKEDKMYNPEEIVELGLVLNTQLKPDKFTIYRLIKVGRPSIGKLPAMNVGTEKLPKYFINGKDLKNYLTKLYKQYQV